MAVWLCLLGLPVEYYREDIIKLILGHIGTPLKLDRTTVEVEREKFVSAQARCSVSNSRVSMLFVLNVGKLVIGPTTAQKC